MRHLTSSEITVVSGGKKAKTTPVGPKKKDLPAKAAHGLETSTAASNKPKKPKR